MICLFQYDFQILMFLRARQTAGHSVGVNDSTGRSQEEFRRDCC